MLVIILRLALPVKLKDLLLLSVVIFLPLMACTAVDKPIKDLGAGSNDNLSGADLYLNLCLSCHGASGEGGSTKITLNK